MDTLFASVMSNPKFMYSSFYGYSNDDIIRFFDSIGVATKVERGNRVFPVSDHSSDVINAMTREMKRLGVIIHYNTIVKKIVTYDNMFEHIELGEHRIVDGDACIVATGGISYITTRFYWGWI